MYLILHSFNLVICHCVWLYVHTLPVCVRLMNMFQRYSHISCAETMLSPCWVRYHSKRGSLITPELRTEGDCLEQVHCWLRYAKCSEFSSWRKTGLREHGRCLAALLRHFATRESEIRVVETPLRVVWEYKTGRQCGSEGWSAISKTHTPFRARHIRRRMW